MINPRDRVPVSLIIDDSTCLVNLAHFAIPQFHEVFPDQYHQPWKTLPREIPDAFVRRFGEWCGERGIKGKVQRRPLPRLRRLARPRLARLVETGARGQPGARSHAHDAQLGYPPRNGQPYLGDRHAEPAGRSPSARAAFMENWGFSVGKSADQLGDYLSYRTQDPQERRARLRGDHHAGRIRQPCPARAGARCRFRLAGTYSRSRFPIISATFSPTSAAWPRASSTPADSDGPDPRCVVSIIGCTGDWFGGWDGLTPGSVDQFITADLKGGRLPEVIARGEPAILVCHWPGMYFNGQEIGFKIFQEVVRRLHDAYDHLIWMKLSQIARYWAARELTRIDRPAPGEITFQAPFACPEFTVRISLAGDIAARPATRLRVIAGAKEASTLTRRFPGPAQARHISPP